MRGLKSPSQVEARFTRRESGYTLIEPIIVTAIMEDVVSMVDQTQPGIFDVRSGSDAKSLEGTPYSEW